MGNKGKIPMEQLADELERLEMTIKTTGEPITKIEVTVPGLNTPIEITPNGNNITVVYPNTSGNITTGTDESSAVTGISFINLEESVELGSTITLQAIIAPTNATNKNVTWKGSNETVATVSTEGIVTSLEPGNTITAGQLYDFGAYFTMVHVLL